MSLQLPSSTMNVEQLISKDKLKFMFSFTMKTDC